MKPNLHDSTLLRDGLAGYMQTRYLVFGGVGPLDGNEAIGILRGRTS